jgi:hypothetical protein
MLQYNIMGCFITIAFHFAPEYAIKEVKQVKTVTEYPKSGSCVCWLH